MPVDPRHFLTTVRRRQEFVLPLRGVDQNHISLRKTHDRLVDTHHALTLNAKDIQTASGLPNNTRRHPIAAKPRAPPPHTMGASILIRSIPPWGACTAGDATPPAPATGATFLTTPKGCCQVLFFLLHA